MSTATPAAEPVVERLERLETTVRRLRLAIGLGVVVAGAFGWQLARLAAPHALDAPSIEVRHADTSDAGAVLNLWPGGTPCVACNPPDAPKTPALLLLKDGAARAAFSLSAEGAPRLRFVDADRQVRLELRLERDGSPKMEFYGAGGELLYVAPQD